MEALLIYIIQVNLLLSIVYLGYALMLKKLTFYKLNRSYFLIGIAFSLVYPFLDVKSWFVKHVEPVGELIEYLPFYVPEPTNESLLNINNLLLAFFAVGGLVFLIRLVVQCLSVWRIHQQSKAATWLSFPYRNVRFPIVPFSFLKHIYLHRAQHEEPELAPIFEHELVHTKGLHSVDVLAVEALRILCWYNPLMYLLRKAVHQNLEYLTDQQVLNLGIDRQTYQYSLLHVNRAGLASPITNKFNFKLLKQRIMMMNKKRSSPLELSKYAVLIPVVVLASGAFTINQVEANIQDAVEKGRQPISINEVSVNLNPIHADTTEIVLEDVKGDTGKIVFSAQSENEAMTFSAGESRDTTENDLKSKVKSITIQGVKGDRSSAQFYVNGTGQEANPLIVVDGIVQSEDVSVKKMDANQIERIDILKDKSGTALYGEKAKDGVVLITTKNGSGQVDMVENPAKNGAAKIVIRGVTQKSPDPLYIVDGKQISKEEYKKIDPNTFASMHVIKNKATTEKYGKAGNNGVIIFKSKAVEAKKQGKTVEEVFGNSVMKITKDFSPEEQRKEDERTAKTLYVIDGEAKSYADVKALNPNDIEKMQVWKDDQAVELYGEKGKHGVIEITTKAKK